MNSFEEKCVFIIVTEKQVIPGIHICRLLNSRIETCTIDEPHPTLISKLYEDTTYRKIYGYCQKHCGFFPLNWTLIFEKLM